MNTLNAPMEVEDLHDLLADSRKGYLEAGNKTKDHAIAGYLLQLCEEREQMRIALKEMMEYPCGADHQEVEDPFKSGLPRAWIDIREGLARAYGPAILAECERSESFIFNCYGEVIQSGNLSPGLHRLLVQQRMEVQQALHALERSNTTLVWNVM